MKTLYKIFRALAVTLLTLVIALPLVLYILLSLSGVQQKLKEAACRELSELLQTPVEIGDLSIYLPSRLVIEDVAVKDSTGVDALWIDRVDAAFEVRSFFENGNIIITLAEIDGLKANLYKETPESPLNIAHIIEALKPKEKNKPPTQFDLRVGHVLIRGSEFAYNVKSMPAPTDGVFDPNHIEIKNINLNLLLPRVSNDHYIARLRRLSMTERSGLRLSNMQFDAELSPKQLDVKSLTLRMPGSTLMLDDMQFKFDGFDKLAAAVFREDYSIGLRDGSHLMPADLAPLYRPLGNLTFPVDLSLTASGLPHRGIRVQQFIASSAERGFAFKIADARLTRNVTPEGNSIPVIEVGETELKANVAQALDIVGNFTTIPPKVQSILTSLETVAATGSGSYSAGQIIADVNVETAAGNIDIDATASLPSGRRPATIEGQIITDALDVARVLDNDKLPGEVSMLADVNLSIEKPYPAGNADIRIASLRYRGYDYKDVKLEATSADQRVHFKLDFNDPHANLDVEGHLATGDVPSTDFYINAHNIDFDALNLTNSLTSRKLSFNVDASLAGRDINSIDGWVRMSNISFINADGKGINLPLIDIDSECSTLPKQITIDSDVVEGRLTGSFNFNTVARTARDILGRVLPAVFDTPTADEAVIAANMENDFSFDFLVKENENLDKMLNLPVSIEAPVEIKGAFSYPRNLMTLNVDAPFLLQKNKIITGSSLDLNIDGNSGEASLNVATTVPTKHGDMSLKLNNNAHDNNVETRLGWKIDHERDFSGRLGLTTAFERRATEDVSRLLTHIAVNPGEAIFNDTVWTVEPATINIGKNRVDVRGFLARHQDQRIAIDGTASADSISVLRLSLNDVDLDYIFETLEINNVAFGGMATGDFYASRLLSSEPRIYTPLLDVKGLSYNGCVMGDGTILSHWDGGDRAVVINATIDQADGRQSKINGRIRPLDEELDFLFEADHAQVGFLQPFMEAFARDVSGEASGTARLYGTFKLIDMVGDLMADSLRLTLDFTGVSYTASDSVHIRPGRIELENIKISDQFGNSGMLNGWLTHTCFKEPVFEFRVDDVQDMLVYDIPENDEQNWYGRVFGNGNASVTGRPGFVNIKVNMTTAPRSTFTFVLSDSEVAADYTFITFRDRDKPRRDSIMLADPTTAQLVKIEQKRADMLKKQDESSIFDMNLNVNITPAAAINLIMDPIAGDAIRSHGQGTMAMDYNSSTEELKMRGNYTLTQGSYTFTLQDIIIKPFTIEPGSSITFNGDPYAAQLNIVAAYSLNANLTDLDESFAQDKELNRTNVPVRALLMATGDMRHPDISFDLDFPTLTSDTHSKVKSIVSTDEMMNRQIIYLLVLNRFYTPEYMASTTKGNELVSVASSTISSQLSSFLGNLSDNWSIAPNFRSDRGDFSDVEVDVALSSHLLNNRLLLNGNFGYRDKSLNNNSFIGDFDIEYLLNRAGTLRLKAYNRYNDQNFYVKNALTTQGVGIVVKRDFDNIFSFMRPILRRFRSTEATDSVAPADSTAISTDTITPTP